MRPFPILFAIGFCWTASACGSDSDSSGAGGGGGGAPVAVSEETFVEALVSAMCSGGAACCAADGKSYDELACHATAGLVLGFASITLGQGRALGLAWDQAAAEACVNGLRAASQSCGATPWDETPCKQVYAPNVGPGQPCQSEMQCIRPENGRAECYSPVDGDAYCLQIQFVAQGAACDALGTECDPAADLYCEISTDACVPRKAAGEPCAIADQCQEGLRCASQVCAPLAATGQACGSSNDCAEGNCADGVCQPLVELGCL